MYMNLTIEQYKNIKDTLTRLEDFVSLKVKDEPSNEFKNKITLSSIHFVLENFNRFEEILEYRKINHNDIIFSDSIHLTYYIRDVINNCAEELSGSEVLLLQHLERQIKELWALKRKFLVMMSPKSGKRYQMLEDMLTSKSSEIIKEEHCATLYEFDNLEYVNELIEALTVMITRDVNIPQYYLTTRKELARVAKNMERYGYHL